MNIDKAQGNWSEIKGKIREKWAKFTDDDIEGLKGNLEQLSGKLQKYYGYAREQAEKEYKDFKSAIEKKFHKDKESQDTIN